MKDLRWGAIPSNMPNSFEREMKPETSAINLFMINRVFSIVVSPDVMLFRNVCFVICST